MIVVWDRDHDEPCVVMTDLPPAESGVCWYALRFWIELGFKALKSVGWQWQKTRRTDPGRVSRHWLVLSVATLLALAYGTRVKMPMIWAELSVVSERRQSACRTHIAMLKADQDESSAYCIRASPG